MVGPESTKRPTMGDVAKLAGVSRKTVSRVYNSEPTVAEELVAKVRATWMKALNESVSSLRS